MIDLKVNGKMIKYMVKVILQEKMVIIIMEIGFIILCMEKVCLYRLMEICMKVIGEIIRDME